VFPLFGAFYYWFPKFTGRMLNERLGKWNFWLFFVGFNLTFFPMHHLGLHGMPRRVYTYLPETGWGRLNAVATVGAGVMGVAMLLFLVNVWWSRRRGAVAGPNPWRAATLEWATTSPPHRYSFLHIPTVRGRYALWERFDEAPVITGLDNDKREVLNTKVLDATPDHKYELAGDSLWPLLLALAAGGTFFGVIFNPWAIPIGIVASFIALALWFWRNDELEWVKRNRPKTRNPLVQATPITLEGVSK
jgi:cytochrome c oxidase subunit I+III